MAHFYIFTGLFILDVCKGGYLCKSIIPNGRVTFWCKDGRFCQYFCAEDFEANENIPTITCSSTGQWVPDYTSGSLTDEDFCKRKSGFQRVYLNMHGSREFCHMGGSKYHLKRGSLLAR